jgi:hypothetical protein
MTINEVLMRIRQSGGDRSFRLAYVRSSTKSAGSIGSGDYIFLDYIDTNKDLIKVMDTETKTVKTLKISHLLTYNQKAISR